MTNIIIDKSLNRFSYEKKCKKLLNNFESIIQNNSYLNDLFDNLLKYQRLDDKCNYHIDKIRDLSDFCDIIYDVITRAPKFTSLTDPFNGLPLLNALIGTLGTDQGYLFYGNYIINKYLKRILNLWRDFLDSPLSKYVLTKKGWLGMSTIDDYKIDKKDKYYGFTSWNNFFIREFKDIDKQRPIDDSIIISGADCHIINYKNNLQFDTDFFDIKGDIYSVDDILGNISDKLKDKFVGGTLVQGFLDAENYHRYHSPVTGKLVYAEVIKGTYYLLKDLDKDYCGQKQVVLSEPFFSNIQTRGVFIFKTKEIGYIAYIVIGMIEVSSCIIYDELIGTLVQKGDEIGYFQYGGSSNIIMVSKKYANKLKFYTKTKGFDLETEKLTKVRSRVADLRK